MPQVELTSNVRRRHDNDKRLLIGIYLRRKVALLEPEIMPFLFYLAWLIGFRYFGH